MKTRGGKTLSRLTLTFSLALLLGLQGSMVQNGKFDTYAQGDSEDVNVQSIEERLSEAVVLYVGSSKAFLNNNETQIDPSNPDVVPTVKDKRTLVPVRFLAESFGAGVDWNAASSEVTVAGGDKNIKLVLGSSQMRVNGDVVDLDVPAEEANGRTLVPFRAIAEALGKEVFYDRGLIVVSNKKDIFDAEREKDLLDELIAKVNSLPTVGSLEKLRELAEKGGDRRVYLYGDAVAFSNGPSSMVMRKSAESAASGSGGAVPQAAAPAAVNGYAADADGAKGSGDYSKTNLQVEGVDEADIVKTDGRYIYQVNRNRIVIADVYAAEAMKLASIVDYAGKDFQPAEMYVDSKYMVVIGNYYETVPVPQYDTNEKNAVQGKRMLPRTGNGTKAIVYDISSKTDIKKIREVVLEGSYVSSRKIGSALYLVANKYLDYYYIQNPAQEATPFYRDSAKDEERHYISCGNIQYFPKFEQSNFMLIGGLDLEKTDEEMKISTYLGAGENIYVSEQNMYIAVNHYSTEEVRAEPSAQNTIRAPYPYNNQTLVYKFSLNKGKVTYLNKGAVPGTILNQFSMDEHKKYFRIATTVGEVWGTGEDVSRNNLYILDDTMNLAGKIEDIAPGEKIYSTRFMGDKGYMVTFKKVDPLFVFDLKDPENPKILGKLKIPGYSDYLHPYDENHIIGFGKDTQEVAYETGTGNATDTRAFYQGMKMAIFDVTDVNNPKEMYVEKIGDRGTDSELLRNHKALMFSPEKNLLAFPVTVMEVADKKSAEATTYGQFAFQGAYVYNIDLEKGFTLKGKITHLTNEEYMKSGSYGYDGTKYIQRILYIGDKLYTLSDSLIKQNAMDDLKDEKELKIPE